MEFEGKGDAHALEDQDWNLMQAQRNAVVKILTMESADKVRKSKRL